MSMENVIIEGFGISNYRNFVSHQQIGPFGKTNIIIGQNNSGKSNILRFIDQHYIHMVQAFSTFESRNIGHKVNYKGFVGKDAPQTHPVKDTQVSLCLHTDSPLMKEVCKKAGSANADREYSIKEFVEHTSNQHNGAYWLKYLCNGEQAYIDYASFPFAEIRALYPDGVWNTFGQRLSDTNQGNPEVSSKNIRAAFNPARLLKVPKKIFYIPAIRSIGTAGAKGQIENNPLDGSVLIKLLSQIKDPPTSLRKQRYKYDILHSFLEDLLGVDDLEISIPNPGDTIHLIMNGKDLEYKELGTGLHQLLMIAIAATGLTNSVILLEEPELHLHPELQKKLLCYIRDHTENQYFITTHSAHVMNTPGATIFHVVDNPKTGASVEYVKSESHKFSVCHDLGYHASDLLQSNAIIWVEGPSDRIYVNHWIKSIDEELIEGIHYSIMFYGGRNLAHLTDERDEDIEDFIELSKLNRNSMILIDSDFSKRGARLKGHNYGSKRPLTQKRTTGLHG